MLTLDEDTPNRFQFETNLNPDVPLPVGAKTWFQTRRYSSKPAFRQGTVLAICPVPSLFPPYRYLIASEGHLYVRSPLSVGATPARIKYLEWAPHDSKESCNDE